MTTPSDKEPARQDDEQKKKLKGTLHIPDPVNPVQGTYAFASEVFESQIVDFTDPAPVVINPTNPEQKVFDPSESDTPGSPVSEPMINIAGLDSDDDLPYRNPEVGQTLVPPSDSVQIDSATNIDMIDRKAPGAPAAPAAPPAAVLGSATVPGGAPPAPAFPTFAPTAPPAGTGSDDDLINSRTVVSDPDLDILNSKTLVSGPVDDLEATIAADAFAAVADSFSRTLVSHQSLADLGPSTSINPRDLPEDEIDHWKKITGAKAADFALPDEAQRRSASVGTETRLNVGERTMQAIGSAPVVASDYRLVKVLGQGGMGTVYVAEQRSLDRKVALKVIKPLTDADRERLHSSGRLAKTLKTRRDQFLSEAVVTGHLDHPNIVPIYDVARGSDDSLFYSMKIVEGTPWVKDIAARTLESNIEILLKVGDAVAFAHSRGVIHRDIKPENVMIGDFGVVMLMDWGLAVPTATFAKAETVHQTASLGGSPAYMAPELATGPITRIGPASDIYLLGAALFEIVTGYPPHTGNNATECLRNAAQNIILPVSKKHEGNELIQIARKAMATEPVDRYASVQHFQAAVRGYLSHAESIKLVNKAESDLDEANESGDYNKFNRAIFSYEEALTLWADNDEARQGLIQARVQYAEKAGKKEDFDLGLSLLDEGLDAHRPVAKKLRLGQQERKSRQSRIVWLRRASLGLLFVLIGGGALSVKLINDAVQATALADKKTDDAKKAQEEAEIATGIARKETQRAVDDTKLAVERQKQALGEAQKAEETAKLAASQAAQAQMDAEKAKTDLVQANKDKIKAAEDTKLAQAETMKATIAAAKAAEDAKKADADAKKAEMLVVAATKNLAQAEAAQKNAEMAKAMAEKAKASAEQATMLATQEKQKAEELKKEAEKQAESSRQLAAEEQYLTKIQSVLALIKQNNFERAREVLSEIRAQADRDRIPLGWEYQRLLREVRPTTSSASLPSGTPRSVRLSPDGRAAYVVLHDGEVRRADVDPSGRVALAARPVATVAGASLALPSRSGARLAVATTEGQLQIRDAADGKLLGEANITNGTIADATFLSETLLAAGCADRTIRLVEIGDSGAPQVVATAWHPDKVVDLSSVTNDKGTIVAAAYAGRRTDGVKVWALDKVEGQYRLVTRTDFRAHAAPVTSVAVSPDGDRIASADETGRIFLWSPRDLRAVSQGDAVRSAVAAAFSKRGPAQADRAQDDFVETYQELHSGKGESDAARLGDVSVTDAESAAHFVTVRSLDFSADGRQLVSSGDDFLVKVWDVAAQREQHVLRGHSSPVLGAVISPLGQGVVVSIGQDRELLGWELSRAGETLKFTGAEQSADVIRPHANDEIFSVRFDAAGKRLVTASRDHTSRIVELEAGTNRAVSVLVLEDEPALRAGATLAEGTDFSVFSMERRGDYLIVGGADSIVRVWKDVGADGCREISTAARTGTNLRGFAVTRDGQWMVTGSSDPASLAKLWKITDGELKFVRDFAGKGAASERITSLAISNDGKKVYGGTDKGVVFVWDAASGEITATLTPSKTPVVQIRTLANDDLLIAADDGSLRKYTGPTLAAGAGAQVDGFVDGLAVSDDDSAAVVIVVPAPKPGSKVADPSGLAIVDLKTMAVRVLATPKTGEPGFRAVRFAPESLTFHTLLEPAGNQPASIATWEAGSDRGAKLAKERAFPVALQAPVAVLSDKSGDLFTIHGHEVYRWDAQSFSMKLSYRPHYQVPQAAFSADGAIVGNCSQSLKLWNARTGKAIAKLETVHKGPTWSLDFSPKATGAVYHFVTSGSDGLIKQWTWEAGAGFKEVRSLAGHKGAIRSVIYSPDGTQILSTGDDGTARLWSVENGQELRVLSLPKTELNGETVPFVTGRFSPDGQFILVAADRNAYLWSADAAANAAPLRRLVGHSREVQAVGFLGTGPTMRLVTGSRDRSLRVWDPRLGRVDTMAGIVDARELVEMTRHEEAVTALDVSRKGLLVSVGRDGNVNLWPSEPDTAPQRGDMVRGDAPARTTIAAR